MAFANNWMSGRYLWSNGRQEISSVKSSLRGNSTAPWKRESVMILNNHMTKTNASITANSIEINRAHYSDIRPVTALNLRCGNQIRELILLPSLYLPLPGNVKKRLSCSNKYFVHCVGANINKRCFLFAFKLLAWLHWKPPRKYLHSTKRPVSIKYLQCYSYQSTATYANWSHIYWVESTVFEKYAN